MKKVLIPKHTLLKLYGRDKLSTRAIAKSLKCGQGVILKRLKDHKIRIRHPNKEIKITNQELEELYIKRKLSTYKIAAMYGCDNKTVFRKLRMYGIETRPKIVINIPKSQLNYLYHKKKWPLSKIAKKFSCDTVTVFDRMKRYRIPSRTMSEALTKYPKKDFNGNLSEKAYLIGFRLGDLNAYKDGLLIYVQSSTTKNEQLELMKNLFQKYGRIWIKKYGNAFKFQTALNKSFSFLVPSKDNIEKWILKSNKLFFAFLAGYIDAEGSITSYKDRLRVRIRSYDKGILSSIHKKLKKVNMHSTYRLEIAAGRYNNNQDFWSLSINKQADVKKLKVHLRSLLQHQKRRGDLGLDQT